MYTRRQVDKSSFKSFGFAPRPSALGPNLDRCHARFPARPETAATSDRRVTISRKRGRAELFEECESLELYIIDLVKGIDFAITEEMTRRERAEL